MKQWMMVCIMAVLALCAGAVHAGGGVVVSVSPSVATVDPGQTFNVEIRVDEAYLLHGSSIIVRFDNSILALTDAADGDVYTTATSQWFTWNPKPDAHADSVLVDQAILGASVYSGSGTLFSLSFTALAPGTSPLTLSHVDLRDNNNQPIGYQKVGGSVNVRSLVANVKAFLQGPYIGSAMTTGLNTAGIIPLAQPYSVVPWSYAGTEAVASIPSGVVDWVLMELRTGTAAATKVATRAAFIKSNGAVVDLDGTSPVGFGGLAAGSYYIVLRHRNHLAVMSAAAVALTTTSALYDFSTGLDKYYGGDAKDVAAGVYGLWAGDVTANGIVKYNLAGNDRLPVFQRVGGTNINATVNGYYPEDVNMNGQVKYNLGGNDRLIIFQVVGGANINATRTTKVPG